jgi:protocatechuate 3,4-dioxygenase beta subunit
LAGRFSPAPRDRELVVERRADHSWKGVTRTSTAESGAYRVSLPRPGVYRVRAGRVAGPAVRVR